MERLRKHNFEKMLYAGLDTAISMEQPQNKNLETSITEDGWTPEILEWFIAAIAVAMENENNRRLIQKMRNVSDG